MFGVLRPCRHRLPGRLRAAWWAHLCGLCLALRDEHGQLARATTNYDGLVVSVLVEAQSPSGSGRRRAGPCPLRGLRTAEVSQGAGARLAASASLLLAAAKLRDHTADGDSPRALARLSGGLAGRWARQGARTGHDLGFDTGVLVEAVGRQAEVERSIGIGSPLLAATEPTETATAAVFAHTAALARRPANVEPLREAGRLFGRIVHLLDAVEDLEDDRARGAWNPLPATGTSLAEARRHCDDALLGVRLALREATFDDGALAHALLVHELDRSVTRAFGHAGKELPKPYRRGGLWQWPDIDTSLGGRNFAAGCGAFTWMCCTCQFCCRDPFPGPWSGRARENHCDCDCCPCDCCDCDCCSC